MNDSIRELTEKFNNSPALKGCIKINESLKKHTTMKTGGEAVLFVSPRSEDDARFVMESCILHKVRCFPLGGGSNVVPADGELFLVILSSENLDSLSLNGGTVTAGSGIKMSRLTSFLKENSLGGFEKFAGLPGTIGGAAFMNARCYEKDVSSNIKSIEFLEIDGKTLTVQKKTIQYKSEDWDYKKSPFTGKNAFITKIELGGFEEKDPGEIKKECDFYINDRIQKGHFKFPSAGSVFKNNHAFGAPSGKLIDECGLKGLKIGGAQIAPFHGNFIINIDHASAEDIHRLVKAAQKAVREKFGFELEPEIIFV